MLGHEGVGFSMQGVCLVGSPLCRKGRSQRKSYFSFLGLTWLKGLGLESLCYLRDGPQGKLGKGWYTGGVVFVMSFVGVTLLLQAHNHLNSEREFRW